MAWDTRSRLALVLGAVALHSAAVGLCLMFAPAIPAWFGLGECPGRFYRMQGGMFHVVMAVAYALGAARPDRFRGLVPFAIVVKFMAAGFLLTYYLVVDSPPVILLSGLGDGAMGALILLASRGRAGKEG
jgi:hypothetical protein